MTTMADVMAVGEKAKLSFEFFGATEEGQRRFHELFQEVGKTLMKEQGIDDPEKARVAISRDTVLGDQAGAAFQRLQDFVAANCTGAA